MALPATMPTNLEAVTFLETLFDGADDGYAVLWTRQSKKSKCFPLNDEGTIELMARIATKIRDKHDVYVSICPIAEEVAEDQRGTTALARTVPGTYLDLDVKPGAFTSIDAAITFAMEMPFQPTMLIRSGGGVQAYWLFKEPFLIASEADRASIQSVTRRWLMLAKKRAAEQSASLDSTVDLARVFRVSGTFNHKEEGNPRPVRTIHLDPSARYNLSEIEDVLPEEPMRAIPPAFQMPQEITVSEEIVLRRARRTQNFRFWWDGGGDDASAADLSFCNALVAVGASAEQIDALFRKSNRVRDKWDEAGHWSDSPNLTYGQGTITKAFDGTVPNHYANVIPFPQRGTAGDAHGSTVGSAEAALWQARALAAELRVEELEDENAQLRADNTALITVTTNPSLKAEAATVIRTAIEVSNAKRRGDVDEDGFVRIQAAKIGDDYEERRDNLDLPIRSKASVGRHLKKVAEFGLIEREVRTVQAPRAQRDREGKVVTDPATGRTATFEAPTQQTWVKMTGESIAELLRPFSLFRVPDVIEQDDLPKSTRHGGDRRSAAFQATRTPCPECGSTARKVFCASCLTESGVMTDITEIAEADEQRAYEAARVATRGANEGVVSKMAPIDTCGDTAFQDETDPLEYRPPSQTEIQQAYAFASGVRAPADQCTDVAFGRAS